MLLGDLPRKHHYKIVFMQRPVTEVAASQHKMIERLETDGANLNSDQIAQRLHAHRRQVVHWLCRQNNVELCLIDFPRLVQNPKPVVDKLVKFLGTALLPEADKMASVVRPDLYRQKS